MGAGVTDAVEEQVEEAAEGVRRVGRPARAGLVGVGVSGRRRLVTSLSGAFRWRLTALDGPGGVAAGFIGIRAASREECGGLDSGGGLRAGRAAEERRGEDAPLGMGECAAWRGREIAEETTQRLPSRRRRRKNVPGRPSGVVLS